MDEPFKERLKKALVTHRLRQADFAKMAGVSSSYISNLLIGHEPRLSYYLKIEKVLRELESRDLPA